MLHLSRGFVHDQILKQMPFHAQNKQILWKAFSRWFCFPWEVKHTRKVRDLIPVSRMSSIWSVNPMDSSFESIQSSYQQVPNQIKHNYKMFRMAIEAIHVKSPMLPVLLLMKQGGNWHALIVLNTLFRRETVTEIDVSSVETSTEIGHYVTSFTYFSSCWKLHMLL